MYLITMSVCLCKVWYFMWSKHQKYGCASCADTGSSPASCTRARLHIIGELIERYVIIYNVC